MTSCWSRISGKRTSPRWNEARWKLGRRSCFGSVGSLRRVLEWLLSGKGSASVSVSPSRLVDDQVPATRRAMVNKVGKMLDQIGRRGLGGPDAEINLVAICAT